jgi:hypothetical protein
MPDKTALQVREEAISPLAQMFESIMEVVKDPSVSPEKMSALLDVQERMIDRQARMDFNRAKMLAMNEMPVIDKNGVIKNKNGEVQSRFARFEDIDRIVRPICRAHGLQYSFNITEGERGAVRVAMELGHVGGWMETYGPMSVPLDASGAKNPAQGSGSSSAYGKRYVLCGAFNIITAFEDNDGRHGPSPTMPDIENDWQQAVLDGAQLAAATSPAAYEAYFKSMSPMRRGWLVEAGHHETLKASAEAVARL